MPKVTIEIEVDENYNTTLEHPVMENGITTFKQKTGREINGLELTALVPLLYWTEGTDFYGTFLNFIRENGFSQFTFKDEPTKRIHVSFENFSNVNKETKVRTTGINLTDSQIPNDGETS